MNVPNSHVFKEYDIRGIVEKDFNPAFVAAIGKAFGSYVIRRTKLHSPRICIGRDVRLSGPDLFEWLTKGVLESGSDVIDLGVCPTPATYFSLFNLDVAGAIMITGSHNPKEYNGFKLCFAKTTLFGDQIQEIRRIIEKDDFSHGSGKVESHPIVEPYFSYHIKRHQYNFPEKRKLKVVVDSGNATAALVMPELLRGTGCQVVELFCTVDGNFPNHHPDPTIPENLKTLIEKVKSERADIGLAFDGDSDRLGVVDEKGQILWGDDIVILLGRDILKRNPEAKIIGEVKCSQRMYDAIEKAGGNPIMWKTGHSLIKNKMKEEHALLAGEMSGHLFLAENHFGYDDAIHAGLEVVRIMRDHFRNGGRGLSELLSDLPHVVNTPEIRTDCPDHLKFAVVEKVKNALEMHQKSGKNPEIRQLVTIDGVRAVFENGWGLVRASNTQPILVSRFEATSLEFVDLYREFL